MIQYYSKAAEATDDRVTHLYRTKYKREVKREGYKGKEVWTEGMKRAHAHMLKEVEATKVQPAKTNTNTSKSRLLKPI
jgi:hypothetical protein